MCSEDNGSWAGRVEGTGRRKDLQIRRLKTSSTQTVFRCVLLGLCDVQRK